MLASRLAEAASSPGCPKKKKERKRGTRLTCSSDIRSFLDDDRVREEMCAPLLDRELFLVFTMFLSFLSALSGSP